MKTYEIPARILVQLNDGPNPTKLSEFVIRAQEGGRRVSPDGVVSHQVGMNDVSYGLLLALHERILEARPDELEYIKSGLSHLIGEASK